MTAVHKLAVVAVSATDLWGKACGHVLPSKWLNHDNSAVDSLILLKFSLMVHYGIHGLLERLAGWAASSVNAVLIAIFSS